MLNVNKKSVDDVGRERKQKQIIILKNDAKRRLNIQDLVANLR